MFEYDLGNIYDLLAGQEFGIYAGRGKKYWHRQVLPDDQFVVVLPWWNEFPLGVRGARWDLL